MDVAYDYDLNQSAESKFDKTSNFLFVFFYINHNLGSR